MAGKRKVNPQKRTSIKKRKMMKLKESAEAKIVEVFEKSSSEHKRNIPVVSLLKKKIKSRIQVTTRNSLHSMVEKGKINRVKKILSQGTSVHTVNKLNETALHVAVYTHNKSIVRILLNYNARVTDKDYEGHTPFHFVAMFGDLEVLQLLLNALSTDRKSIDINARTLLRQTPLHFAAQMGRADLIECLIQNGAEVDARMKPDGATPLHLAVAARNTEVVRKLLNFGANVNCLTKEGLNPLHCAVLENDYFDEKTGFFYQTVSKLEEDEVLKQIEIIEILVGEGGQFSAGGKIPSPLHFAVKRNNDVLVKVLLKNGAEVNARDQDKKMTSLHWAAGWGSANLVRILLDAGADINLRSQVSYRPIHYAAFYQNEKVVSTLINAGADINEISADGESPINIIYMAFEPSYKFLNILLESGVDINAKDSDGSNLLHFLCDHVNFSDFFAILIDQFLDLNAVGYDQLTPLESAVSTFLELPNDNIEFLIKAMVKMESTNKSKISENNMHVIKNLCLDFYKQCQEEIKALKKKKVWGNISFFDLIDKPMKKLVEYCRNTKLVEFLNSGVSKKFQLFGSIIESRMQLALEKKELIGRCIEILDENVKPVHLPKYVTLQILDYLNTNDLETMSLV